jgi:hypothetical protein
MSGYLVANSEEIVCVLSPTDSPIQGLPLGLLLAAMRAGDIAVDDLLVGQGVDLAPRDLAQGVLLLS